jgi:diguanylate cyclase (GGDEF)-like protein
MGKTHDFTKILWGKEFVVEAPLEGVHGTMTGEGQLAAGDEIVLCVKCRVDEVEYYTNTEIWQAKVSFDKPISNESDLQGSPLQSVKNLVTQLGDALYQGDLYQRIEQIFTTDRTIQIANRGRFDSRLSEEWRRLRRDRNPISLILCAFDGLPAYQEVHGEQATVQSLQEIAQGLRACVKRPSDLVARYQDQMFAVLLPNTPEAGVQHILEAIRVQLSPLSIFATTSKPAVTLRLGTATMVPSIEQEEHSLVQAAARSLS